MLRLIHKGLPSFARFALYWLGIHNSTFGFQHFWDFFRNSVSCGPLVPFIPLLSPTRHVIYMSRVRLYVQVFLGQEIHNWMTVKVTTTTTTTTTSSPTTTTGIFFICYLENNIFFCNDCNEILFNKIYTQWPMA